MSKNTYRIYWIIKSSGSKGQSELMDYKTAHIWANELNKMYNGKNGNDLIIHHVADYRYTDNWIEE
jgi:hypothetical protein